MLYAFESLWKDDLYYMHDLSLSLGLLRDVIWWMWFVIKQIGIVENDAMESVLYWFNLSRLTLGIGNLLSSHSLSAGYVPLGLGRDKVGIRALAQFMHFQC